MKKKYLECMCGEIDHVTRFMYFTEDEEEILYMESFLAADHRFFHRIWNAINYVFGRVSKYRSCYAQTSDVILNKEKATELRDFLDGFIKNAGVKKDEQKDQGKG